MSAVLEKPVEPPSPLREFWQGFAANRGALVERAVDVAGLARDTAAVQRCDDVKRHHCEYIEATINAT